MPHRIQLGLVIVLLFTVLVVFISPAVDLEPTALRAARAANLVFFALVQAGCAIAGLLQTSLSPFARISPFWALLSSSTDLVDVNCVRLC